MKDESCMFEFEVCDFRDDCEDGSDELVCGNYTRCDFENEDDPLCGWNSDHDADLEWQRSKAGEVAQSLFPNYGELAVKLKFATHSFFLTMWQKYKDHTRMDGQGHFYHNTINQEHVKTYRISSPIFEPVAVQDQCVFRFWYYLIGIVFKLTFMETKHVH